MPLSRRRLLSAFSASALTLPFLRSRYALAGSGIAERIIFFYFPDGVVGASASGEASKWHATGSEHSFSLPEQLTPLEPWRDHCVFLNGLSMGGTDSGSHPGGAKKLLTAADYGNNESIDQYLARTVGADMPWRHLYLGAMACENNASGDKFISYPIAGSTTPPIDDPRSAFSDLFGTGISGSTSTGSEPADTTRAMVVDGLIGEVSAIQSQLSGLESDKIALHLESLYELESRLDGGTPVGDAASCADPDLDIGGVSDDTLYDAGTFPDTLKAQIDLMVLAMECGMTRVGTIQCSHNTSELVMSRFPGTDFYDPGYDMRSHQASHYGDSHNPDSLEYASFLAQRKWFVSQLAYLLEQLAARSEGDGTMLDHTTVVLCTEVCDGNTHSHDNMPLIVAGGGGGAYQTGRLLQYHGTRHGDLWVALAQAMGADLWSFGDASSGPLSGFLG